MELRQLIRDQRQELEEEFRKKKIIEREVEKYTKNIVKSKLIKVITGIRRCGKSILARVLVDKNSFVYMNFDDERLPSIKAEEILPSFFEIYGKNFSTIFLDEIQNIEKWELFVNRLHRAGFNLVITGSNARLLSKELATHLTGRHLTIELFPFSFKEYLKAIEFKEDIQTTRGISLLKKELGNYINSGGFPEIIAEKEDPVSYLRELYTKIIERDIVNRYNISYKKTFREIAMTLLSNPARGISYNRIKNQFNLGSEHTVKNYISYLEEAYLIFSVSRFSHKPVEVEKSEKKIYIIDTGFINNMTMKSTRDYGHLYENIVAIELLRKKSFKKNFEIYYWKNQFHEEVDLVIKEGLKVKQLIQVCYKIDDADTKKRELRSLLKASKDLKCKDLVVITADYDKQEKLEKTGIRFIPLWKWLLQEN